ncbi:acyl-CoA dehydrogenase family protein [Bordetella tumulicola]|uniref:acyl-CoA dehydrogenase family protein n=1 Tax=Bordetella tumulicola TaxID=1649133 RepID=UPI0039F1148A
MNDVDQLLNDSAVRFFTDLCTRSVFERVEHGDWLPDAWADLQAMGLTSAAVTEFEPGQVGLALPSLALLVRQAGRFNVPLPLVETYLAQRALSAAGVPCDPDSPLSLSTYSESVPLQAQATPDGYVVSGMVRRVPWGRHVAGVVAPVQCDGRTGLALLPPGQRAEWGTNLAGEPRDALRYERTPVAAAHVALHDVERIVQALPIEGALLRSVQMTGAAQQVLEMTVQYATERVQFGRPIAKFQAIQHQIAELAAQVASATAAADAGIHLYAASGVSIVAAFAKIRASEAATQVCAIAHQVHGAMGFTHEHPLHLSTRRLMSWRDEFGSDTHWAAWAGERLEQIDERALWAFITAPSDIDLEA